MQENFLVGVGVQKAATSSLAQFLEQHGVCVHPKKELHAFNNPTKAVTRDQYLRHFPDRNPEQWFGEFTPAYSTQLNALLNIRQMFPDARVILSYRNPVERLKSAFVHAVANSHIPPSWDINDMIDDVFKGQLGGWLNNALKHGRYDVTLPQIERIFKSSNIRVMRFEDFTGPKEGFELGGLLDWLGIVAAEPMTLQSLNNTAQHRARASNKSQQRLNAGITEDRLERLQDYYLITDRYMTSAGYKTEWF